MSKDRPWHQTSMSFHIDWDIQEEDWEKTRAYVAKEQPGGKFDRIGQAFFWALGGHLQLRDQHACLYPQDRLVAGEERGRATMMEQGDPWYPIPEDYGARGTWVSILDFANQLVRTLVLFAHLDDGQTIRTEFFQNDGGMRIYFTRDDAVVTIRSTHFMDLQLLVPFNEFTAEARRFLLDFIAEVDRRLPEMRDWISLKRLHMYAATHKGP
jgi:hypothetical protein